MGKPDSTLPSLTGLRGIAACWVLLFHIGNQTGKAHPDIGRLLDVIAGGGFLGVDIFFVLSGFVIALNYSGKDGPRDFGSYLRFLQKRLARVYPVYLFVLLVLVAAVGFFNLLSIPVARPWSRDLDGLLKSLLLVQGWTIPITSTWNIPSWSVSTEWLAYLLFPVVSLIATRLPGRFTKLLACVVLLGILPYVVPSLFLRGTMAFGLPRIAVGFTLGVLIHSIWTSTRHAGTTGSRQWLALALVLLSANALAIGLGEQRALLAAPLLAGTLVWILASPTPTGGCLTSGLAQHLGRISYSLYIVHGVWILLAQSLLRHLHWTQSTPIWVATMATVLAGSLLSAHVLYTRIEEPARQWLARQPAPGSASRPAARQPSAPDPCLMADAGKAIGTGSTGHAGRS